MEQYYYLLALVVSIFGLATLDYRFKLALWFKKKAALQTIFLTMLVFIVWDLLGIGFDIFYHGGSKYALPYRILPEFPIEELFFLFLLCYTTLLVYIGAKRIWHT